MFLCVMELTYSQYLSQETTLSKKGEESTCVERFGKQIALDQCYLIELSAMMEGFHICAPIW